MSTTCLISSSPSGPEDDHLVDAVQELGPEMLAQLLEHQRPHLVRVRHLPEVVAPQVRGHDHDGVAEVHRPPVAVREAAVVEHLEERVPDVGVRLLDLVEQHDRVRAPPHRLGELAALLEADVAGRRADEPRHRVLLHVLGHVDPHHGPLVVEQELGERPRELRLADAGRPEEQERADGPVRIRQARARPPHGVRDRVDGLRLAHDAPREAVLHLDELLDLALEEAGHRDAGPLGDDLGHILLVDLLLQEPPLPVLLGQARVPGLEPLLELVEGAEPQLGRPVEIAAPRPAMPLGPGPPP